MTKVLNKSWNHISGIFNQANEENSSKHKQLQYYRLSLILIMKRKCWFFWWKYWAFKLLRNLFIKSIFLWTDVVSWNNGVLVLISSSESASLLHVSHKLSISKKLHRGNSFIYIVARLTSSSSFFLPAET